MRAMQRQQNLFIVLLSMLTIAIALIGVGCVHKSVLPSERLSSAYEVPVSGGLSDLFYSKIDSERVGFSVFYSITDRGPNGKEFPLGDRDNKSQILARPFFNPEFVPTIYKLGLDQGQVRILAQIPLKDKSQKLLSGRPNLDPRKVGERMGDEVPMGVGRAAGELAFDPWGIDSESLVIDERGEFWVGEEYGPSIFHFSNEGVLLERFVPQGSPRAGLKVLPAELSERKLNRGFEAAVLLDHDRALFFLQSPRRGGRQGMFADVVEFSLTQKKTIGIYHYPMDLECGKIGAATVNQGKVLVLEQNGKLGAKACQRIFEIKLSGMRSEAVANSDQEALEQAHVMGKTLFLDLAGLGLDQFEKLEGLAVDSNRHLWLVNDNDFALEVGKAPIEPTKLIKVQIADEKKLEDK